MIRFVWSQLRGRVGRTTAVLLGVLVATTGFTVLTGATDTSQLVVRDTVEQNARGAYDILVRPTGSRTAAEEQSDRVRPNFLSDVYGGIAVDEWARVRRVPGVEIAAPVAMFGFVPWQTTVQVDVTAALDTTKTRQVILLRPTSHADRGLTAAADAPGWVYVTRRPIVWPVPSPRGTRWDGQYSDGVRRDATVAAQLCSDAGPSEAPYEIQEDGREVPICATGSQYIGRFDGDYQYRRITRYVAQILPDGRFAVRDLDLEYPAAATESAPRARLQITVPIQIPQLVAGIDPAQEAALTGLDRAVTAGRYLSDTDLPTVERTEIQSTPEFQYTSARAQVPAIVAGRPYLDEQLAIGVARVDDLAVAGLSPKQLSDTVDGRTEPTLFAATFDAADTYMDRGGLARSPFSISNWTLQAGTTEYTPDGAGALDVSPRPPASGQEGWGADNSSVPLLAHDVALRPMLSARFSLQLGTLGQSLYGQSVGVFDPSRVIGSGSSLATPIELYRRPVATGADDRTSALLGGQELLPSTNPGSYLTTPPTVLISLAAHAKISDDAIPISAIRVRVAGIHGFDEASRERIRLVAQDIAAATGLDVDITYGASPGPQTVVLPPGSFGRPDLSISELWSHKGVAAIIVRAIDRKSMVLFILILVVSGLFLANAVSAAVRDRRTELAVLACLGWPARRLAAVILTEVGVVGLVAGGLSAAVAPLLGGLAGVAVSTDRALLAIPVAFGVTLLAGVVPALRAARSHPIGAVRPAVRTGRRARRPGSLPGLALAQLGRVPGRTALGALALAVGICAVTLLAAVTFVFHGTAVGTLLGDAVSLRARGVDLAAALGTVGLGAAAIADVAYLNIRERASELAALRATGWSGPALVALVTYEGIGIGVWGAVGGAAVGLGLAALLAGAVTGALLLVAAAVAVGGILVAALATAAPATLLTRLPLAPLLAEE